MVGDWVGVHLLGEMTMPDAVMDVSDFVAKFIAQSCIEFPTPGTFFYGKAPGTRYSKQYYLANLFGNPQMMRVVVDEFFIMAKREIGHLDFVVCGREWSALPLLGAIINESERGGTPIPGFIVRRDRKTYGIHNFIEGGNTLPPRPALIIDDLCNSTNSFHHCHRVCRAEGIDCLPFIFSVLNKYRPSIMGQKCLEEDRYLGEGFRPLTICNGDHVHAHI